MAWNYLCHIIYVTGFSGWGALEPGLFRTVYGDIVTLERRHLLWGPGFESCWGPKKKKKKTDYGDLVTLESSQGSTFVLDA